MRGGTLWPVFCARLARLYIRFANSPAVSPCCGYLAVEPSLARIRVLFRAPLSHTRHILRPRPADARITRNAVIEAVSANAFALAFLTPILVFVALVSWFAAALFLGLTNTTTVPPRCGYLAVEFSFARIWMVFGAPLSSVRHVLRPRPADAWVS